MGEPKPFASLSSGLLARKGAARPAMKPQGFGQVGSGLEDLGWNDMGFEAPKPVAAPVRDEHHDAFGQELSEPALRNPLSALTPAGSSPIALQVHDQQAEIADRFSDYTEESSDEEYVDETAELYDPEAEAAAAGINVEDGEEGNGPVEVEAFVLSVKQQPSAFIEPVAPAPVADIMLVSALAALPRSTKARVARPRAASGGKAKAAFTLRIDAARHLRLRLACVVSGRSAQQLVTEALDELIGSIPELDAMADRAPTKRVK